MPRIEDEYLIQSTEAATSGNTCQEINPVDGFNDNFDWDYFLAITRENRVSPLLYFYQKDEKESFSKNCFKQLENDYFDTLAYNTFLWKKLKPILKSLEEKKIPVILLKGIALGVTIYPSIGIRPMGDMDILIKEKDIFEVDETFKSFGYKAADVDPLDIEAEKTNYLTTLFYPERNHWFHVHRHLINSTLPNFSYISKINMNNIWQKAQSIEISGSKALVLSPEHQIIYLCEHSMRVTHSFRQLIFHADISRTIYFYRDKIDWENLIKESFNFGLERMVYCGLYAVYRVLHTEIPSDILTKLKPKRLKLGERKFFSLLAENRSSSGLSYFVHLAMNKKPSDKIKFIFRTLFPPKEMLAQKNGIPSSKINTFHYLSRIKDVLGHFFLSKG